MDARALHSLRDTMGRSRPKAPEAQEGEEGPGEQRAAARHGRQDAGEMPRARRGLGLYLRGLGGGSGVEGAMREGLASRLGGTLFLLWRGPNRMWYGQVWAG